MRLYLIIQSIFMGGSMNTNYKTNSDTIKLLKGSKYINFS